MQAIYFLIIICSYMTECNQSTVFGRFLLPCFDCDVFKRDLYCLVDLTIFSVKPLLCLHFLFMTPIQFTNLSYVLIFKLFSRYFQQFYEVCFSYCNLKTAIS